MRSQLIPCQHMRDAQQQLCLGRCLYVVCLSLPTGQEGLVSNINAMLADMSEQSDAAKGSIATHLR